MNQTPVYKLGKPLSNEKYSVSVQNNNMDIIENELKEVNTRIDDIVAISEDEIINIINSM